MTFYRIVAKDDESKGGIKFPEHVFYRVLEKKGLQFIVIFRPHWNMERKSSTEKERFLLRFRQMKKSYVSVVDFGVFIPPIYSKFAVKCNWNNRASKRRTEFEFLLMRTF